MTLNTARLNINTGLPAITQKKQRLRNVFGRKTPQMSGEFFLALTLTIRKKYAKISSNLASNYP
jgi:hypothetical protein